VKWIALLGRPDSPTDGVADYCAFLARALEARGIQMSIARVRWAEDGWFNGLRELWRRSAEWRGQWVILQYTALAWSRRGFPFAAVVVIAILRRRGVRCAVVFHEPYHQSDACARWIDRIRAASQDWVIRSIYKRSKKCIFADPLATINWLPKNDKKGVFVPIGANVPECTSRFRVSDKWTDTRRIVVVFCLSDPPNRQQEVHDISHAVRSAAAGGLQPKVVFVGRGTAEASEDIQRAFAGTPVEISNLGLRTAEEISHVLSESDAMLCVRGPLFPRRGSALAGVVNGIPIVAYGGSAERTHIAEAGVQLVPYRDLDALASALLTLLTNRIHWQALHDKSLVASQKYFSWGTIAGKLIETLDSNGAGN
jgi:glycosyltransferase involved in cell wall biosynthesis